MRRLSSCRRYSDATLFLVAACLAACSGEGRVESRGDSNERTLSTLTIAYCCDEWLMSPFWNMPITHAVFLPLTRLNPEGELEGRLADPALALDALRIDRDERRGLSR